MLMARPMPDVAAVLAAAAHALSGPAVHAASFNCQAATTQVERMTCTESRVSEGDERVALAYRLALQSAARPDDVRAGQRQWVRMLSACKDSGGVALAQDIRLQSIAGGESGPGTRPVRFDWARDVRDQYVAQRVPFFFKQSGGIRPKAEGRGLDGQEWN